VTSPLPPFAIQWNVTLELLGTAVSALGPDTMTKLSNRLGAGSHGSSVLQPMMITQTIKPAASIKSFAFMFFLSPFSG
jgi:hypothetical protein